MSVLCDSVLVGVQCVVALADARLRRQIETMNVVFVSFVLVICRLFSDCCCSNCCGRSVWWFMALSEDGYGISVHCNDI